MEDWFSEQEEQAFAVFAGVVFEGNDTLSYKIRTLFYKSAGTEALISSFETCRDGAECPADAYLNNGFMELQMAIDSVILAQHGIPPPRYSTQRMPKDKFNGDSSTIRAFAPIFYLFAYSFFIQVGVVCPLLKHC